MIYNLQDLKQAYLSGKKVKFLFFWGHTPPADGVINESCFSQWWRCRFQVEDAVYSCAEQFMMAEKARMFADQAILEQIMAATHPKEMKARGRLVNHFDQAQWEAACYTIVKRGNLAKFGQNAALGDFLRQTRNRILVEASPRDRIWGIGMGKNNPSAENPLQWRGRNLLGFALTEVRDQLFEEEGD